MRSPRSVNLTLLVLSVLATACDAQHPSADRHSARAVTAAVGARPAPREVAGAVDSLAARIVAEGFSPGFGLALVMDGRTVLARSYGFANTSANIAADDRTLWYIASTSKSLTGFGVSLLMHQGVIDVRAPITSLLATARWPRGVDADRLTLAEFLSHTHHLRDDAIVFSSAFTGAFDEAQWPAMLRFARPSRNSDLEYSNLGYNVAAMVIDAKRPEGWRRYLDSAVYRPAGMTDTYARVGGLDPRRIAMPHDLLAEGRFVTASFPKTDVTMHAAGGHVATLRDLARWVTVHLDSGVIDGQRVFPAEAVALSHRMMARQTRDDRKSFAFFSREGWAAGWDIGSYEGERMVSRFGSYASLRSHLSFLPARRIGVVAQSNGNLGSRATDIIAAFAYDLERGDPRAREVADARLRALAARRTSELAAIAVRDSTRAARPHTLRRSLTDFAGTYEHPWYGTLVIERRGDSLHWTWGVLDGTARVMDARTCSWRGCRDYNALIIDVAGSETAVEFDLPPAGFATALTLRDERFVRR